MSLKLEGSKELARKLNRLAGADARRMVRKAVNTGANPILKDARSQAPKDTGLLRKSIGKKVKTYKRSGSTVAVIGPRTGFEKEIVLPDGTTEKRDPVRYAHLVELGTKDFAPKPFMRTSMEQNKQKALDLIAAKLREEIGKAAKKK